MSFKSNFNRICREKGTTPTALLHKMGEAHSKVARWNSGSLPKEEMMIKLAQELECSVMDFFADEKGIVEDTVQPLDEDERDILRVYRSLPRRSKHEFMSNLYRIEAENELIGDSESDEASVI